MTRKTKTEVLRTANVMLHGLTADGNWRIAQDPKRWVESATDVPVPDETWRANRENDALFVAAAPGLVRDLVALLEGDAPAPTDGCALQIVMTGRDRLAVLRCLEDLAGTIRRDMSRGANGEDGSIAHPDGTTTRYSMRQVVPRRVFQELDVIETAACDEAG